MQPRISIIVPCYNGEKYLHETLNCLCEQTLEDWECVIVNDGSTDQSLDIMKEYAERDSRYRYIDKQNEGPSVARNTAIAASQGKYILPLDADDLIAPSYAEKAVNYFEGHSDCKLVYCKAKFFGDIDDSFVLPEYDYHELPYNNSIFCSCVYRRNDFNKTIGYNPNMKERHEDWDFLLSLLVQNDKVYCIPEVLFYYRIHGVSRNTSHKEPLAYSNLQMVINHPEIYTKDMERTLDWINPQTNYYKNQLISIKESWPYRIGNALLKPFILIKHLMYTLDKKLK